jgi:hypothetical protein
VIVAGGRRCPLTGGDGRRCVSESHALGGRRAATGACQGDHSWPRVSARLPPRTPQQGIMSGTVHGAASGHDAWREGRPSRKGIDLVGLIPFTLHSRVNPGFATKIRHEADQSCILLDHEEDIIVRRWTCIRIAVFETGSQEFEASRTSGVRRLAARNPCRPSADQPLAPTRGFTTLGHYRNHGPRFFACHVSPRPRAIPPLIASAPVQTKSRLIQARRSTSTPTFW